MEPKRPVPQPLSRNWSLAVSLCYAVVALIAAWMTYKTLATGVAHGRYGGHFSRADSPIGFWFSVLMLTAATALFTAGALAAPVARLIRGPPGRNPAQGPDQNVR